MQSFGVVLSFNPLSDNNFNLPLLKLSADEKNNYVDHIKSLMYA